MHMKNTVKKNKKLLIKWYLCYIKRRYEIIAKGDA